MFRKDYILPKKILHCERTEGEEHLLSSKTQMAAFACGCPCKIQPGGWILLDFGLEYNGGRADHLSGYDGEEKRPAQNSFRRIRDGMHVRYRI